MTPAARVQAAIEVLDRFLSGVPAEKALTGWARGARYAGSKDRAAVRDLVFQAIRCRDSYAARGGGLTGRQIMIGHFRDTGEDPAAQFTGALYAPAELTEMELVSGHVEGEDATPDLPEWLVDKFAASLGFEGLRQTLKLLRHRAPVTVRLNRRKTTRSSAIALLAEDGIVAHAVETVDTALHLTDGARRLSQSRAYLSGDVELQDAHSQSAMACLDVPQGARVLDYCAGGGGKTLALAAHHEAHYFAHDADARRMKDLPHRARRAGIDVHVLSSETVEQHAPFDLVLCDVPCSGSGTWRRTPDAKWTLTPEIFETLLLTQIEILSQAASLTRRGGSIAYMTCSVLNEENEAQIAEFLSAHPDWTSLLFKEWTINEVGDGFFLSVISRPL